MFNTNVEWLAGVLSRAASYADTQSFIVWVVFLLSFPAALWLLHQIAVLVGGMAGEEGTTFKGLMVVAGAFVLIFGLPLVAMWLPALWSSFDALDTEPNGFGAVVAWIVALALHWMRLIAGLLPIALVILPFQLVAHFPGLRGRIARERQAIAGGKSRSDASADLALQAKEDEAVNRAYFNVSPHMRDEHGEARLVVLTMKELAEAGVTGAGAERLRQVLHAWNEKVVVGRASFSEWVQSNAEHFRADEWEGVSKLLRLGAGNKPGTRAESFDSWTFKVEAEGGH